ncbi:MAG: hypothetical protein F7B17_00765 [Desulfurococcales archaeon]|nr:hypothetical protein [Desulfurococcales archaeon]
MRGNLSLWSRIVEASQFYRRLARRTESKYKATILSLAASALEDLSDDVANGYIRKSTAEKIEYVVRLLKRNYLPYFTLERAYNEARSRFHVRQPLTRWMYVNVDDMATVGLA